MEETSPNSCIVIIKPIQALFAKMVGNLQRELRELRQLGVMTCEVPHQELFRMEENPCHMMSDVGIGNSGC